MRAWVAAAFLLASCGAPGPLPRAELVDPPRAAAPTLRLLRSDTFTDLVRSVRDRGEDSHPESRRPCLVNVREDGALELESDLSLSVRPLPDPARSLDEALVASPHEVALLSLFGASGRGRLLFAAFTPMPPVAESGAVIVVLTQRGAYVRSTGAVPPPATRGPVQSLTDAVRPMLDAGGSPIVLAAGGDVSLGALEGALATLADLHTPVALAVPLEPGTELPRSLAAGRVDEARTCVVRAPGSPPESERVRASLAPLAERARACRASATSAEAARGGVLRLSIHAAADGHVIDTCAYGDALDDADVRRCIEASAMGLSLPSSREAYTVELPLRLARDSSFDRAPLCRESPRAH